MKIIKLLIFVIFYLISSCSNDSYEEQDIRTIEEWGKEFKWYTKQTNSYNSDGGANVEIDSKGNIYFIGTTGVGVGIKDTFYGNKIYDSDIFIIKFNKYYEREWVKTISSTYTNHGNAENAIDIEISSKDNLFILGHGTGYFDNSTSGGDKAFLLKLDQFGSKIAVAQTNLPGGSDPQNISIDSEDNIYLSNNGTLVKYDSNLNLQWTSNLSNKSRTYTHISIDSSNNLYFSGDSSLGSDCTSNNTGQDIVFGKFDIINRSILWEKTHSICNDFSNSIITDNKGNFYVAGSADRMYDNTTTGNGDEIFIGTGRNGYVMKINSIGEIIWTRMFGNVSQVNEMKSDESGNIYITGSTMGSFESGYNSIGLDIFLIKYDFNGNHIWSRQLGSSISQYETSQFSDGKAGDEAKGLTIDDLNKRIYVVGSTRGDLDGNQLTFSGGSHGSQDAFITRTINIDY